MGGELKGDWDRWDKRNGLVVGGELKGSGTDGTRKRDWRNLKLHKKISIAHPERKRQFGRSRSRWNVKDNVMNWT